MFGLSWGQIAIIVLVGVFVLGPERIPTAVTWVMSTLRKARTMAAGAQEELRREMGPEIDELRRQVADLQSLKELQELRDLRDLHPKRLIGKNILGDEFAGGVTGFLGLNNVKPAAPGPGAITPAVNGTATTAAAATGGATSGVAIDGAAAQAGGATPSLVKAPQRSETAGSAAATAMAGPPPAPPSMTKLAAPKVVGRTPVRPAPAAQQPPFDPDGT